MTQRPEPGRLPGLPTDGEAPVFTAPWEAQAFAMAVALHERGLFTWPEWAAALRTRPLRTRRVAPVSLREPGWAAAIRRMAAALDATRRPVMLVALQVGP